MPPQRGSEPPETLPPTVRAHVLGAGPVGLLMTALLQPSERFAVHLYEKRREYTRTRMVQLAPYLVADSVASYCTDNIDEESIRVIFDSTELSEGLAFRQSIPSDLMVLLRAWAKGSCPRITAEEFERMPPQFDGQWLRSNFPRVAESMDRFIAKVQQETNGEIVGDLAIIRIPLDLYRARNGSACTRAAS